MMILEGGFSTRQVARISIGGMARVTEDRLSEQLEKIKRGILLFDDAEPLIASPSSTSSATQSPQ